ncbi:MAG TPA: ABC transporter permease, partial [Gemmatimonadaceae bacterium]
MTDDSYRHTGSFPLVARGPIRFFQQMARTTTRTFAGMGHRVYFLRDIRRALAEPSTYLPQVIPQMRAIGVDSVPLVVMVAAFIGGVIAMQVRYQLFQGIQLSIVGLSVRQIVILETGPLLTGLVLAGRVGAKMTAEIGTMR